MNTDQNKQPAIKNSIARIKRCILLFFVSLPAVAIAQGVNMSNPIVMGTYNTGTFSYTDARNNSSYGNDYGQSGPDIYYKFTVTGTTTISISTCSSGWDTYLHLLDGTGALVLSNDDNGGVCSGLTASILIPSGQTAVTSLAAGTYYIITEGYGSGTGVINLSVSLTIQPPPAPVTYNTRNFVRVWDATAPETNPNTVMTRPLQDVKMSTQYFDGLGRPEQSVIKEGSLETATNIKADLISTNVYDDFGREQYKYLAFPANSTGGFPTNDGEYKSNPLQQQVAFYNNTYGNSPVAGQGETVFYGKTNFEPSPLNRVEKAMAPGNSWTGANRGVEMKYWINTATDDVKKWNVTNVANSFGTYSMNGAYPAGELYKNVTVDEHGKQVIEFKDKEGKVILKKVQIATVVGTQDDGTGRGYPGWLCTYYIYDDLNNLRCVIQPQAIKLMSEPVANWDVTPYLGEQCFRYEYDVRNRMIMKKVPGAGEVYMVYDARDRLIMTQDANLRNGSPAKWMITKYDVLNRPTETGLWNNDGTTFSIHLLNAYSNSTGYPNTAVGYEELSKTFYEDYSWLSSYSNPLPSAYSAAYDGNFTPVNNLFPYAQANTQSFQIKGMVTGSRIKVLGTSTYLYTVSFYDAKDRVIQTQSTNITGGTDIATTQYTWAGQPLVMVQRQQKITGGAQEHIVITKMQYDDLGRVLNTKKTVNSIVNSVAVNKPEQLIVSNSYDKLGQLKQKQLGGTLGAGGLLEYDYNIRGWMLGMNRNYLAAAGQSGTAKFGFELGYDKQTNTAGDSYAAAQYNGNITGMVWKSDGDDVRRKYDFAYDAANRLLKGDFKQDNGGTTWNNTTINYSMQMGDGADPLSAYDANGNIKAMTQYGWKPGVSTGTPIDKLTYSYNTNSNRILKVADDPITGTDNGKLGDFKDGTNGAAANDYNYDVNGNLTEDKNKEINNIAYNYLNLPSVITFTGKGTIAYTYDAAGSKLKKVTTETGATVAYNGTNYTAVTITTTSTYLGGAIFETKTYSNAALSALQYTDKLQLMGHEEGRIRGLYDNTANPNTLTGLAYDYMLKDHLGNVRMVLTEEQKTLYYPAATLEGAYSAPGTAQANSMINYEKQFYNIDNTKVTDETPDIPSWATETVDNTKLYYNHNDIPPASPNPNYPAGVSPTQSTGSNKLYKLNATTNKTGLEFIMKVMAGDKIDIFGKSYFLNTATVNNANSSALDLSALMLNMLTAPGNGIAAKGVTSGQLNTWNTGLVPSTFFRGTNGETTTIPKAYINYIFLDEQFKYAGGSFSRVGSSGVVKNHWNVDAAQLQNITVPKNGYIFVYVSNESNLDVFFDNLQVVHKPGPILEETHYYRIGKTASAA